MNSSSHPRVAEQLQHISDQLPVALITSILVGVLFSVALWGFVDHYVLLGWFAILVVTVIFRLLVVLPRILGQLDTADFSATRRRLFLVASATSGMVWGAAPILFFDPANPLGYAILTMVMVGVAAGAIAPYSSWMPAYLSFVVPLLLPLAGRFLWEDSDKLTVVGIMILIYLLLCILSSANYQKLLARSIDLQFANEDLLEELTGVNQKLHEYSYTDPLTEVPNRRFFDDYLRQSVERAEGSDKSVSLLIVDVDYFKAYNDNYGHDEGDLVLKSIASALRLLSSSINMEVARIGGEEFAVIMFDTQSEQAATMAERIRKQMEQLYTQQQNFGFREQITVSVGVATSTPERRLDTGQLFREADAGLYRAKESGRNQVVQIQLQAD